jgi:hypothetical protein
VIVGEGVTVWVAVGDRVGTRVAAAGERQAIREPAINTQIRLDRTERRIAVPLVGCLIDSSVAAGVDFTGFCLRCKPRGEPGARFRPTGDVVCRVR